jgi:DNA-binding transcriptional LysR family regulator
MRTPEQMEALTAGKIDIAFARPLEPPFDQTLRAELLYQGPPSRRPSPRPPPRRQTRLNRLSQMTPALYDGIVALCSAAGFSPNIINTAATWSSVLTLVESGEGVALVPSGVRYLRPTGVVFSPLVPQNLHIGLAVVWNPQNEDPIQQNFLRLVRDNKDRIQRAHGN